LERIHDSFPEAFPHMSAKKCDIIINFLLQSNDRITVDSYIATSA